jgi:membrane protein implicated in regulation of membrane protease activity
MSIFPNAISVRAVDGPDAAKGIPWLNIIILTTLAALVYGIWVRWRRFRKSRIDPRVEAMEDDFADATGAVSGWFGSWRKKP